MCFIYMSLSCVSRFQSTQEESVALGANVLCVCDRGVILSKVPQPKHSHSFTLTPTTKKMNCCCSKASAHKQ
jgi:hypothetical protein